MIALFDGDILIYKAGFSVETRYYIIKEHLIDRPPGKYTTLYGSKKEALAEAKEGETVELYREAEPLANAIHNLKSMVRTACKALGATDYRILLSGDRETNERFSIATTKPYKGNRKEEDKPIYYPELKGFLLENCNTIVSTSGEADDLMATIMTAKGYDVLYGIPSGKILVIASIDKDMMMVPGTHYNLDTQKITHVSDPGVLYMETTKSDKKILRGYGFKWFCAQMLLGDPVDNIPGLRGYGPVKTLTTLEKCTTIRSAWSTVIRTYRKEKAIDRLDEIRQLLWIRRTQSFGEVTKK